MDKLRKVLQDFGCLGLGFAILYHQAFVLAPGKASEWLLATGLALLGLPAGLGTVQLIRSGGGAGAESPSPSPASSSPVSTSPPPG